MSVVVISPHPDDEAIGCGGAIRNHVDDGLDVHVVFLTSGEAGGHGLDDVGRIREMEAKEAASILGVTSIDLWREPDGSLAVTEALVRRLQSTIDELQPVLIYVTHPLEMHPDHKAAAELLAAIDVRGCEVRTYEVWTPITEMSHVEDISDVLESKLAAVRAYKSQCDIMRFDEAIAGLNRYRGEMHLWPGGPYAEVFGDL